MHRIVNPAVTARRFKSYSLHHTRICSSVGLAALAYEARGRKFESSQMRHLLGGIAQVVERRIENPGVGGSTPPTPTTYHYKGREYHLSK